MTNIDTVRKIYRDNIDVFASGFPLYALWQPLFPPAEKQLSAIHGKVLILQGDKDNPVYSVLTDKVSRGIPHAQRVEIAGGTHFLHLEKPEEFEQLVTEFLSDDS